MPGYRESDRPEGVRLRAPPGAPQLDVGTNVACLKVPSSGVMPTTGATLLRVRGSPPRLAA